MTSTRRLAVGAVLGLLIVPLVSLWIGCGRGTPAAPSNASRIRTLQVLTPHSEETRTAFASGFSTWCLANYGQQVHVNYVYRGTPECVEFARQAPQQRAAGAPGIVADVFFGGGIAAHAELAAAGLSRPIRLRDERGGPGPRVQGLPTRDPDLRWMATSLNTFGIVCNEAACAARGITPPATWTDLAEPRLYGWLSIANPRYSGSHREAMVLILTHLGWEPGWGVLIRTLANARALESRSGDALRQVRSGAALATLAVNSDGLSLAEGSKGALRYVDPPGATAASPNLISILAAGENQDLADLFVLYVIGEPGQALWGVRGDLRHPAGRSLYHYPISEAVYAQYGRDLCLARNPFTEEFGLTLDASVSRKMGRLVQCLVEAACGPNHVPLQLTWEALIARGLPPEPLAELLAPPFDAATAQALGDQLAGASEEEVAARMHDWSALFAEKYARVRKMLGE